MCIALEVVVVGVMVVVVVVARKPSLCVVAAVWNVAVRGAWRGPAAALSTQRRRATSGCGARRSAASRRAASR